MVSVMDIIKIIFFILIVIFPLTYLLYVTTVVTVSVLGPAPQYERTGQRPPELSVGLITAVGCLSVILLTVRTIFSRKSLISSFGGTSALIVLLYVCSMIGASIYGASQAKPGDPTETKPAFTTMVTIAVSFLPFIVMLFGSEFMLSSIVTETDEAIPLFGLLVLPFIVGIPAVIGLQSVSIFSKSSNNPYRIAVPTTISISLLLLLPFIFGVIHKLNSGQSLL